MSSRREMISDYFRRQYETKEGTAAENVESLFSDDLTFHLTGDKVMGREELIGVCDLLRRIRHGQSTMVSSFEEDDDIVSFVLHIVGKDPVTGHEAALSTATTYRFDGDRVVEVWQDNPEAMEETVRAAGFRL